MHPRQKVGRERYQEVMVAVPEPVIKIRRKRPLAEKSGVRQGSSLLPSLFNVFINKVIIDLKKLELGCYVNKTWIGCIHYTEAIILLSASLSSLPVMLNNNNIVLL